MTRFADRVALVTGAAQGMGFAIAARMLRDGASVILADINADGLARAVTRLSEWRESAHQVQVDITSISDVARMIAEATGRFGRVDILVNNAGVLRSSRVEQIAEDPARRRSCGVGSPDSTPGA